MQYQENNGYRKLIRLRKYLGQILQRTEEHTDGEVSCLCGVLMVGFGLFFPSPSPQEGKLDFYAFSFSKCLDPK